MAGLGKFLKQAQKMQEQMQKVQEELAQRDQTRPDLKKSSLLQA